jgi:hypothetical protein
MLDWLKWQLWWKFAVRRRGTSTFSLNGHAYSYFYHYYNHTWNAERAVEVPVMTEEIRQADAGRVLEVGNVLSHYGAIRHDVVDKYEKGAGAINVDIMDFKPSALYDLVVSISTLEHIGWDERPRTPGKALRAYERLTQLLAENGRLVVTFPAGYNAGLDAAVHAGEMPCTSVACLKRRSFFDWAQVELSELRGCQFNSPYPYANGMVFLSFSRSARTDPVVA